MDKTIDKTAPMFINTIYTTIIKYIKQFNYEQLYDIPEENTILRTNIVKAVIYFITNLFHSKYEYGLLEKMFLLNFNFFEEISWIIFDHKNQTQSQSQPQTYGLFNIKYKDQQDRVGHHRAGWQYIYENITDLHTEDGPFLDLYIDETLHWSYELYKLTKCLSHNSED